MNKKINLIKLIQSQKDLIIIAIIISIIFGLQHIIMISKNHELYNPLPVENVGMYTVEELAYASNVNDVINGNYFSSNAHVKNKSGISNSIETFPNIFLGLFAGLFGLNATNLVIVSDFVFPPILFLLYFYICHKILSLDRIFSVFVSLFVLLFGHDVALVELVKNLMTLNISYFTDFFYQRGMFSITRFMHPEFTLILMLLSLIFLYNSFAKKGYFYPVVTGLMASVLAYSYFYYVTFFWATFSVFAFFILIFDMKKENIMKIGIIALIGVILSIPYAVRVSKYNSLPYSHDLLLRIGASFGRNVNITALISAAALVVALYFLIFDKRKIFLFLSSAVIGGALLLNLQLLTGYTVQYEHWWFRIINPVYVMAVSVIAYEFYYKLNIKRFFKFISLKYLGIAGIITLIIFGIYIQSFIALSKHDKYKFSKNEILLYDWLNKNTLKGSAVLTISINQNSKIPAFTHNTIYLPNGLLHNLETEEIVDRLISAYGIFGVSNENLMRKLALSNKQNSLLDFEDYDFNHYLFHFQFNFRKDRGYPNPDDPNLEDLNFPKKFREFVMDKKNSNNYKAYDYDYVLIDTSSEKISNTTFIKKTYKKIYSNDDFSVYLK